MTRLDPSQIITLIIGSSGVIGAGVTVYQVRKNSSSAAASTEVEQAAQQSADWGTFTARIQAHMDFQDGEIQKLRAKINELNRVAEHNRKLERQIWLSLPPPPVGIDDPWPQDPQVGG